MELEGTARTCVPISVVIPVFERPALLEAALVSVGCQSVAPAEIIVVDDGSSNPESILRAAGERGATVVRQKNAGPAAARNAGMQAARAPWIAFLDSDDLWLPRKLECQWEALRSTRRFGAAICDFRMFTDLGSLDETAFDLSHVYQAIPKRPVGDRTFELLMPEAGLGATRTMFVQVSGLVVERKLALGIGGFDPAVARCEDHEFVMRLFAATRVLSVEQALVRYRVHPDSLSRDEVAMRTCAVEVAEKVLARPDRYPPGATAIVKQARAELVMRAAAAHVKSGDVQSCRTILRKELQRNFSLPMAALLATTLVLPNRLSRQSAGYLVECWRRRPWRRPLDWESAASASTTLIPMLQSQT